MKVYTVDVGAYEQKEVVRIFSSEEKAKMAYPEVKEWEVVVTGPRRIFINANRDKSIYAYYEGCMITEWEVE